MVNASSHALPFRDIRAFRGYLLFPVNKLCIFIGTTVGSALFWYLGEYLELEFFGCFMLSGLGSIVGVIAGWKLARKLSE